VDHFLELDWGEDETGWGAWDGEPPPSRFDDGMFDDVMALQDADGYFSADAMEGLREMVAAGDVAAAAEEAKARSVAQREAAKAANRARKVEAKAQRAATSAAGRAAASAPQNCRAEKSPRPWWTRMRRWGAVRAHRQRYTCDRVRVPPLHELRPVWVAQAVINPKPLFCFVPGQLRPHPPVPQRPLPPQRAWRERSAWTLSGARDG